MARGAIAVGSITTGGVAVAGFLYTGQLQHLAGVAIDAAALGGVPFGVMLAIGGVAPRPAPGPWTCAG